jgi:hypothetical protein
MHGKAYLKRDKEKFKRLDLSILLLNGRAEEVISRGTFPIMAPKPPPFLSSHLRLPVFRPGRTDE